MANITLLGASYSDVPAVELPRAGGGTATFYEDGCYIITLSYIQQGWRTDKTFEQITAAYNSGKTLVTKAYDTSTGDELQTSCQYVTSATPNYFEYTIYWYDNSTSRLLKETYKQTESYSMVTGVTPYESPKTLVQKTITANGTYDPATDSADGYSSVTVNVSGGASNYVSGEFTTQSSAGVQSITIPYTGNGYPIACMVFIKGGAYNSAVSPWYSSMQRYAVGQWTMHKAHQDTAPNYASSSGSNNYGVTTWIYKNSTSSSTSYSRSSAMNTNSFSASNASNSGALCCRFRSNTNLTVYVNTSGYGLLPNQDYVYHVIYSE